MYIYIYISDLDIFSRPIKALSRSNASHQMHGGCVTHFMRSQAPGAKVPSRDIPVEPGSSYHSDLTNIAIENGHS